MFTTKLTRAAPRATAAFSNTSTASTAQRATQCLAHRPRHERRPSSSKASTPPDSTSSGKAAAAAPKAKTSSDAPVSAERSLKTKAKSSYRRAGGATAAKTEQPSDVVDHFAGLPSVPSIQGIDTDQVKKDLSLSSFFSLHRPISITTTFPPPTTEETFSSLFEARNKEDPWRDGNSAEGRPEDIVITLNNTIEMLENNSANAENEGMRWEVISESQSNSDNVKHLDGAPQPRMKSLDEIVANFRPFRAPPAPEPFDQAYSQKTSEKRASTRGRKPKQKVFVTEIRVTESTHSNGQKTWSASSSPIVQLPEAATHEISEPTPTHTQRQTFLERKRRRQQMYAESQGESSSGLVDGATPSWARRPSMGQQEKLRMHLISVKRQRKLKMKKHKHKKLMKRTRNLRRRLGRT